MEEQVMNLFELPSLADIIRDVIVVAVVVFILLVTMPQ